MLWREGSLPSSASGGCQHFEAGCCITPASASVVTLPSLCVYVKYFSASFLQGYM